MNSGVPRAMSQIYMVRHGQACLKSDNYDQLSALGHQQSQWLGEYFQSCNLKFDHIYQGDMVRHNETVDGISRGMGVNFKAKNTMAELNEFDFESLLKVYVQQYPEKSLPKTASIREYYHLLKQAMHDWSNDGLEGDLPESWSQFQQRVETAYSHIQENCEGTVLVVSSGGTNSMLLAQVLKAPAETVVELNLQSRNTGLSHFFFNKHAIRLTSFNNTPHLDTHDKREFITFS